MTMFNDPRMVMLLEIIVGILAVATLAGHGAAPFRPHRRRPRYR